MRRALSILICVLPALAFGQVFPPTVMLTGAGQSSGGGIAANCPTCNLVDKSLTLGTAPAASSGQASVQSLLSTGAVTLQGSVAFSGGATSSGANSFDLSGSSGAFKTSTGANTFGGSSNAFTNSVAFNGGATATGATAFDLSGSTGAFKTSTGAGTFGGSSNAFTNTVALNGGASASGSSGIDLSGSTGLFKTSTGANTFGGSSNSFTNAVGFAGGATASGSSSFDLSGSTGTFKTSTGAGTFGGSSNTFTNGVAFNGGATASGSSNFDLSGGSGAFKTTTGASTFGGSSNSFTNAVGFAGGATASGSSNFDLSGGTGTFKTTTGATTLGGSSVTVSNQLNANGNIVTNAVGVSGTFTHGMVLNGGPIILKGNAANSASAIGVELQSTNSFSTAGSLNTEFVNGSALIADVDYLGNFLTLGTAPRQVGSYQTVTNADTAFTAIGMPSATLLNGTAGTADTSSDTAYNMIKYTSSGSNNNAVGISGPFTTTGPTRLPIHYWVIHTDASSIATTRIYVGFVKSSLDQVTTLAGANTINACVFRYDTTIGDTDWMAESSDGTTASATDSTIAVAAATTVILGINDTVSGTCGFWVNGAIKVTKVSNITTAATAMGIEASITELSTTAHSLSITKYVGMQN